MVLADVLFHFLLANTTLTAPQGQALTTTVSGCVYQCFSYNWCLALAYSHLNGSCLMANSANNPSYLTTSVGWSYYQKQIDGCRLSYTYITTPFTACVKIYSAVRPDTVSPSSQLQQMKDLFIRVSDLAVTPPEAEQRCRNEGGELLNLKSPEKNNFFKNFLQNFYPTTQVYVMGLKRLADNDTWVWGDGTATLYTDWNTGEPNRIAIEPFTGLFRNRNYRWVNLPWTNRYNFICEQAIGGPIFT